MTPEQELNIDMAITRIDRVLQRHQRAIVGLATLRDLLNEVRA